MVKKSDLSERQSAIHLLRSGLKPVEVAQKLGRSLAWVYKWRQRFFEHEEWSDLQDRVRVPHHSPRRLPEAVRQAIRQARSELEAEAAKPGQLSYIGSPAVQSRLRQQKVTPLPSLSSIERVLSASGLTHPHQADAEARVSYPHLEPVAPHQLIQADIVTRFLPGSGQVACFNAIDVVSHYPVGQQYARRRSLEAVDFLIYVWQMMGIPEYTQLDNEGCFSGGFTHPGVLGKVVRLGLFVGTELLFSPIGHPESNGSVERFHQDYVQHVWAKCHLPDLAAVQQQSPDFFAAYRQSEHIASLQGSCPTQRHQLQPVHPWPADIQLPECLPLTSGQVHFMRRVDQTGHIRLLNLSWSVPKAVADQGVWATLTFSSLGATLRVYDAAPDALQRTCLAQHPFPFTEPVHPLRSEFQRPIPVPLDWFSQAADLARIALSFPFAAWFSTMS